MWDTALRLSFAYETMEELYRALAKTYSLPDFRYFRKKIEAMRDIYPALESVP